MWLLADRMDALDPRLVEVGVDLPGATVSPAVRRYLNLVEAILSSR